jgi:glycosyltransferase involved in cell wall biosynthesis
MIKNKRVLLLTYYYPPFAGVGSQRTGKFGKFLPEYGWDPVVFTVDERYYGTRVIRQQTSQSSDGPGDFDLKRARYLPFPGSTVLMKLAHPLLALWFTVRHRRDLGAVYMSGSPFHPFLLTPLLTGVLRIPTVLDFRDSWSINHGYDGSRRTSLGARLREKAFQLLEGVSIRFASRVVFATSRLQEEYAELFPRCRHKFSTIHNGFDPEDVGRVTPHRQYPGTTLILAGKFYTYTPEAVDALMEVLQAAPDLWFVYVGEEHAIIKDAAHRHKVSAQVTSLPFQPQQTVLELTAGADIGLVTNGMVNGLGTKIFEYLALGKPAVCLVPQGSVISSEFGSTPSVLVSHPPHTASRIAELLQRARTMVGQAQSTDLAPFNRRTNAGELAKLLDELSG